MSFRRIWRRCRFRSRLGCGFLQSRFVSREGFGARVRCRRCGRGCDRDRDRRDGDCGCGHGRDDETLWKECLDVGDLGVFEELSS